MCNNSVFQQQRRVKQLESITGFKCVKKTQLSPRKFEVLFNTLGDEIFGNTVVYHFYFGDDGVTYKRIN